MRAIGYTLTAAVFLLPLAAQALPTFNVTTTLNTADASVGDTICADINGLCSLRAAVQESNASNPRDIFVPTGTYRVTTLTWNKIGRLSGQGPDQTHIVGDGSGPVLVMQAEVPTPFYVEGVSISGGVAPDNFDGGGLFVGTGNLLTLADVEVFNNRAPNGAGLACYGSCTILRSYVHDNEAVPPAGSEFSSGGGIAFVGFQSVVRDSAIANNEATYGAGLLVLANTVVVNSTVSSNLANELSDSAFPNGEGAGIYVGSSDETTLELFNTTVANNHADRSGGGVRIGHGMLETRNSIIADNTSNSGPDDCSTRTDTTALSSMGYNIIGEIRTNNCLGATQPSDHIGAQGQPVDAGLLALADNGGPTPTHNLIANSIAIDGGDPAGCRDNVDAAITADQRGVRRANGGSAGSRCDIGSLEVGFGTDEAIGDSGALAATLLLPLLIAGWMRRRLRRLRLGAK